MEQIAADRNAVATATDGCVLNLGPAVSQPEHRLGPGFHPANRPIVPTGQVGDQPLVTLFLRG